MDEVFAEPALAIYAGDLDQLGQLIADDPGIPTRTSTVGHPTLLQLVACEAAQLPDPIGAARLLVEGGAALAWPLVSAAGCNSLDVVEYLLDVGADVDGPGAWTPLDEALYWSNTHIAAVLVTRGARIRALSSAAGLGDLVAMASFFENGTATADAGPIGSPFANTVPLEKAHDQQSLLDHAFVMAVNCGKRSAAEDLLGRGALVNAVPPGYHWQGTALHAAVWRGDARLVGWLLSLGADPSIRDGLADADAASWAAHHGHPELLELLQGR